MKGLGEATLDALYPRAHPYRDDPVGFARDILGVHLWSKQRRIAEACAKQGRVSVRACHGVGKTKLGGVLVIWFLCTRPGSRVITTAPTWAQVRDLLWRSLRADVGEAQANGQLQDFPPPDQFKWDIGPDWFATGLSTDQPERFQGHHATELFLLVDEASGVAEAIYEAAEGFLTADGALVLLIGNPTRIGGTFHRSHTSARDSWACFHISVLDSPNYTGEQVPDKVARALPRAGWAEEKAKDWGADSPAYQVRVLGNFSDTSDRNVISLGDVEEAQARTITPDVAFEDDYAVIACDVARFGSDETVIVERVGWRVRILERYVGKDTVHTASRVAHHAGQHFPLSVTVVIDDTGVGGGVTDILRAQGHQWPVVAFNGGSKATQPMKYPNRRSEAWFQTSALMEYVDLDEDEQLLADLTSPEYRVDDKLRRVVEKKDQTKARLGRSPDRADAVVMALSYALPSKAERIRAHNRRNESLRRPVARARTAGLRERAARGT